MSHLTSSIIILFLIKLVYPWQTCGSFIPKNAEECHQFSDIKQYCCFFTDNKHPYANFCKYVNMAEYLTHSNYTNNTYSSDGYLNMTISCGETITQNQFQSCGTTNVTEIEDCVGYNTPSSSCCYYNYMGEKGCVSYDYVIKGSIINGNVILQCSSSFISTSLLFILFGLFLYFS